MGDVKWETHSGTKQCLKSSYLDSELWISSALSVTGASSNNDEGTTLCSHSPEQGPRHVQEDSHKHQVRCAHVFGQKEMR